MRIKVKRHTKQLASLLLVTLLTLLTACGGGGGSPKDPVDTPTPIGGQTPGETVSTVKDPSLIITGPTTNVIGSDAPFLLSASYIDEAGVRSDVTTEANWSSSALTIATISQEGLVTLVHWGTVTVEAAYKTQTARFTLTIDNPNEILKGLSVTSNSDKPAVVGDPAVLFNALALTKGTTTKSVNSDADWSSSDEAVAKVSAAGRVTFVSAGTAKITAKYRGFTGSFSFNIAPITSIQVSSSADKLVEGDLPVQLSALGLTPETTVNRALAAVATWSSSDDAVAKVDAAGVMTIVGSGSTIIKANFQGVTGSLNVSIAPFTTIGVDIDPSTLPAGSIIQFSALGLTQDTLLTRTLTPIATWNSSNPAVAKIDSSGLLKILSAGSTIIDVAFAGASGQLTLNVAPPSVGSADLNWSVAPFTAIEVSGNPSHLVEGDSDVQLFATGLTQDSSTSAINSMVTWSSSDETVATVDASGVMTIVGPGSVTINAQYQGVTGSLNVAIAPFTTIEVSIDSSNLPVDGLPVNSSLVQFSALGLTQDTAVTRALTSVANWSSSNEAVAKIDTFGLLTILNAGSTTVKVDFAGATGELTLNVAPLTEGSENLKWSIAPFAAIKISGKPSSLVVGDPTVQFFATGVNQDSSTRAMNSLVTWNSSDKAVAKVDASGVMTIVGPGSTTINAQYQGVIGSVNVSIAPFTTININSSTLPANSSLVQLSALGLTQDTAVTRALTSVGSWSSSNETVAKINSAGLLTLLSAGSTTIKVGFAGTIGELALNAAPLTEGSGSLKWSIAPFAAIKISGKPSSLVVGDPTVQFFATGVNQDSSTRAMNSLVTWSSSDKAVAKVDASGVMTIVGPGSTTINAQYQGVIGNVNIAIAPFTTIGINIDSGTLPANGSLVQLSALGLTQDTAVTRALTSVASWSSSNETVAKINSTGLLTLLSAGSTTIKVGFAGATGELALNAAPLTEGSESLKWSIAPFAAIEISGKPNSLVVGDPTVQLFAKGLTQDSTTRAINAIASWSSSDESVAKVDASGVMTIVGPGITTINAKYQGIAGSLSVNVAPFTTIGVNVDTHTLPSNTTLQLSALGITQDVAVTRALTSVASWSSSNETVAKINSAGLLTLLSAGSTTIKVGFAGATGELMLNVAPLTEGVGTLKWSIAPFASIKISGKPSSLVMGDPTVQLFATGLNQDSSTRAINTFASWSSSNETVAKVNASGVLTIVGPGAATISASLQGVTGSLDLSIAPLTSIVVTSSVSNLTVGFSSVQLSALGLTPQASITRALSSVATWHSSNEAIATVDASGLMSIHDSGTITLSATHAGTTGKLTLYIAPFPSSMAALDSYVVLPSLVNLVFEVLDENGQPVTDLADQINNYHSDLLTIKEDGEEIIETGEAFAYIQSLDTLDITTPTVYAIDISSSMKQQSLLNFVDDLRSQLSTLEPGQSIALLVFDGNIEIVQDLTFDTAAIATALNKIEGIIINRQSRTDNFSTNLYGAAIEGMDLWRESFIAKDVVKGLLVLITDGEDEGTKKSFVDVLKARGAKNIFSVYVGANNIPPALVGLSCSSTEVASGKCQNTETTMGSSAYAYGTADFSQVPNVLIDAYLQAKAKLAGQYYLEYSSPRRSGTHTLSVTYNDGSLKPPSIVGSFDAKDFYGVSADIAVLSNLNIPLGVTRSFDAITRWTNIAGDYTWRLTSGTSVTLSAEIGSNIEIKGTKYGSSTVRITDNNNYQSGSFSSPLIVTKELTLNVTDTSVLAPTKLLPLNKAVMFHATTTAVKVPKFNWSFLSGGTNCKFRTSRTGTDLATVINAATVYLVGITDMKSCRVDVIDTVNGGSHYPIDFTVERYGPSLSNFTANNF